MRGAQLQEAEMAAEKKDVEAIFTGALQRPSAGERTAYVDGACGD